MTPPTRGKLGRGLAALIPPAPPAVPAGQRGDDVDVEEASTESAAAGVAAHVVHSAGRKSATAAAEGAGYDLDPAVALLEFYADYCGYLDEVDPVEWEDFPRRDLKIALAFANAGPRLVAETVTRVRTQHRWSWSEIARVVGTTRQAAAQRWGRSGGKRAATPGSRSPR